MIELVAFLLAGAPDPLPESAMRCVFAEARALGSESKASAEAIAAQVVTRCAFAAGADAASVSDATRMSMHAAGLAAVRRVRGVDGQPADAPIRVPSLSPETDAMGSFKIPDEIAPAVLPYVSCLAARARLPVLAHGKQLAAPATGGNGDCDEARKKASREAHLLLQRQGRLSEEERRALIEGTLSGADAFMRAGPPVSASAP